jgi:uroporphyrinogen-III synthase
MLPLANRRILITRAAGQASKLAALLEAEGAETIVIPTIEIAPPSSWCALDAALSELRSFDWLLFTSANAVQAFVERARALGVAAYPKRIAVIGPATAAAVKEDGLAADEPQLLLPERYVAESLAEALLPYAAGARMLLVRAAAARDVLPETLRAAGAYVMIAEAYRNVVPHESAGSLRALFATRPPDAITFTSASTAHNLASLLDGAGLNVPAGVALASIGPVTSQAMRELGLEPTAEAAEATLPALVSALAGYFTSGERTT